MTYDVLCTKDSAMNKAYSRHPGRQIGLITDWEAFDEGIKREM